MTFAEKIDELLTDEIINGMDGLYNWDEYRNYFAEFFGSGYNTELLAGVMRSIGSKELIDKAKSISETSFYKNYIKAKGICDCKYDLDLLINLTYTNPDKIKEGIMKIELKEVSDEHSEDVQEKTAE